MPHRQGTFRPFSFREELLHVQCENFGLHVVEEGSSPRCGGQCSWFPGPSPPLPRPHPPNLLLLFAVIVSGKIFGHTHLIVCWEADNLLQVLYMSYACVGWVRRERVGQGNILIIGLESLGTLVTNSLTHSILFSKLDWCDPGVWRRQFKTCWGCFYCRCWCWGSCWQQFVADLGTEVWSLTPN